jgi:hypothetical protein
VPGWGVATNADGATNTGGAANTIRSANATVAAHKNAPTRLPSRYPPASTQTHR